MTISVSSSAPGTPKCDRCGKFSTDLTSRKSCIVSGGMSVCFFDLLCPSCAGPTQPARVQERGPSLV